MGLVVAGYLVYQINEGEFLFNDAFEMVAPDDGQAEVKVKRSANFYHKAINRSVKFFEKKFKMAEDEEVFEEAPAAAILWPDLDFSTDLAAFFERLAKTRDVKTLILLGENHKLSGKYELAFSQSGYDTVFGKLELDSALQERFLNNEKIAGGTSFWALNEEQSIDVFPPFIKKTFPDAQVVTIAIKDFAKEDKLIALAEMLNSLPQDEIFVIASTAFSQEMEGNVSDFHFELSRAVLETFDISGIEQMDIDSRPVVFTLMKYLDGKKAKKVSFESPQVVTFYKGESVSNDRNLTILTFGDLMLGRYVRTLIDEAGSKNYVFENIEGYEGRFFEGADIVHGNLEGPIKGEGKKGGTAMVFAFNEDVAPFLKKVGFNLMSLANNHAVDQGWDGRESTINALNQAGLSWCGHPSEPDPLSVYSGRVGEKKLAFVCFHDVTFKLDDAAALDLISKVREEVDYLIVSIHWGYEYKHSPDWGSQIEPGRAFIDAGADFVIGHHPHVVQSFEIYNGKFIFYSLGNFVFDQYWSVMTQEELALGIVLDDDDVGEGLRTKVYLFPMKSELSQSRLMTAEERSKWIEEFIGYGEYSEDLKAQIRNGIIEF